MLKIFKLIITLLFSITVLASCTTAEESPTESEKETVTANTEAQKGNQTVDTEKSTTEKTDSTITFSSKGESKTEELTPISGERYTLHVIPGFSLTSEEPGKDLLLYDQNDSVSMRIEMFTTSATTFKDLVANTEQTIAAVSGDYQPYNISPIIKDQNLSSATAYIANSDDKEIISFVFVKAEKLVRLTIFDSPEVDLSEAMIKMGLTIE